MSGWLFLGVVTLICVADFVIGLRFARSEDPAVGAPPAAGAGPSAEQRRRIGRIFMVFAPVFWLVVAAMCFGVFGPVPGIDPIMAQAQ
jgi:hypothetical protein